MKMLVMVFALFTFYRYEDRIAKYWPEFAQHDKGSITIGDLMAHRAVIWVPKDEHVSN